MLTNKADIIETIAKMYTTTIWRKRWTP